MHPALPRLPLEVKAPAIAPTTAIPSARIGLIPTRHRGPTRLEVNRPPTAGRRTARPFGKGGRDRLRTIHRHRTAPRPTTRTAPATEARPTRRSGRETHHRARRKVRRTPATTTTRHAGRRARHRARPRHRHHEGMCARRRWRKAGRHTARTIHRHRTPPRPATRAAPATKARPTRGTARQAHGRARRKVRRTGATATT